MLSFALAGIMILRDQRAHMWNAWDHSTKSKSHPNIRQDLCIFSDLLTLLNIKSINLLLLLVKMVFILQIFLLYCERGNTGYSNHHRNQFLPIVT